MNRTQAHPIVRRAGILSLALFLISCAAGLGYVAHLTRKAAEELNTFGQPSLLPLVALALMIAVAGFATLRFALHDNENDA